jgi:Activator of Hsp90 ATPase homolog 1-like protein
MERAVGSRAAIRVPRGLVVWFRMRSSWPLSRNVGGHDGYVVADRSRRETLLRGEMTITLADADGGTDVLAVHDGLPRGLSTADNEAGWREALSKLAALGEAG